MTKSGSLGDPDNSRLFILIHPIALDIAAAKKIHRIRKILLYRKIQPINGPIWFVLTQEDQGNVGLRGRITIDGCIK